MSWLLEENVFALDTEMVSVVEVWPQGLSDIIKTMAADGGISTEGNKSIINLSTINCNDMGELIRRNS